MFIRSLTTTAVLLVLTLSITSHATVVDITTENFESAMEGRHLVLVLFYRTDGGCENCDEVLAAYDKASDIINELNPPPLVAKHDTTPSNHYAMKHGVFQYPTIKIFRNSEEVMRPFRAPLTVEGISGYAARLHELPSVEVKTVAEAEEVLPTTGADPNKIVLFGFYKPIDNDLYNFQVVCEEVRDSGLFTFIHTMKDEVMREFKQRHTFVIYNLERSEELVAWDKDEPINKEKALDFVAKHGLPLVGILREPVENLYFRLNQPRFYVFADTTSETKQAKKHIQYLKSRLKQLAKAHLGVHFVIVGKDYPAIIDQFGYSDVDVRRGFSYGIAHLSTRFKPEGVNEAHPITSFDMQKMDQFLHNFQDNKLTRYVKSQPPFEKVAKPGDGKIIELTGNTFRDVVFDENLHVLVALYAPWCGYCKALMPELEDLASHFKGDDRVAIAMMDATQNEMPTGYHIQGYPTVYFAPKHNKVSPEQYDGERASNLLENFVRERIEKVVSGGSNGDL